MVNKVLTGFDGRRHAAFVDWLDFCQWRGFAMMGRQAGACGTLGLPAITLTGHLEGSHALFDFWKVDGRVPRHCRKLRIWKSDMAHPHLKKIVDLLTPNMWLELDRVAFARFFDHQLDNTAAERNAGFAEAEEFAMAVGASVVTNDEALTVRFGRASPKQEAND